MRDYMLVKRLVDPVALERFRMKHMSEGYVSANSGEVMDSLAYVSFQELATRVSHRNTGTFTNDPMCERLLTRISTDENLHMIFYRNLMNAALQISPNQAMAAILKVVKGFEMPGTGIPGFQRKAVEMAVEGIYDLRQHRDDVLAPVLRYWKVFELEGLSAQGEAARTELADFMEALEKQALRFEDKRDMLKARMAAS
jgi:acyl-[acyl-carrier-protein] desaturase